MALEKEEAMVTTMELGLAEEGDGVLAMRGEEGVVQPTIICQPPERRMERKRGTHIWRREIETERGGL